MTHLPGWDWHFSDLHRLYFMDPQAKKTIQCLMIKIFGCLPTRDRDIRICLLALFIVDGATSMLAIAPSNNVYKPNLPPARRALLNICQYKKI